MHIFVNKPAYLLEDYITAIGMAGGIGLCIKEAVLSFEESQYTLWNTLNLQHFGLKLFN